MSAHGTNGGLLPASFSTIRLELATKLAVLTALIFAGMDTTPEDALDKAVLINDLCDSKARELKEVRR